MKMKEIREAAEALMADGITSKAKLMEAVPVLVEAQVSAGQFATAVKRAKDALAKLSEACAKYVLAHPDTACDAPLAVDQKGVRHGQLMIDGHAYNFVAGYKGLIRADGGLLTQEFMSGLPKEWVKVMTGLDTTIINREPNFAEAIAKYGLVQKAQNVWTDGGAADCPVEE